MANETKITVKLSKIFTQKGEVPKIVDHAIKAALSIVEEEYVRQAPGNLGDFKQGIEVQRKGKMNYLVASTATTNRGANYPLSLYTGTGRLKGSPDFGYTSGHVRSGTVAWGIGGVRPNKAAKRAKKNSEVKFMRKLNQLVSMAIQK